MKRLKDIDHNELLTHIAGFCNRNNMEFEEKQLPNGRSSRHDFIKVLQMNHGNIGWQAFSDALKNWQNGIYDIRKERRISMWFIGQILKAHRESSQTANIVDSNRFTGEYQAPPKTKEQRIETLKSAWEIWFNDWVQMMRGAEKLPLGASVVFPDFDNQCLQTGVYSEDDFTNEEIDQAWNVYNRAYERVTKSQSKNRNQYLKVIKNRKSVNKIAIGRFGAWFTRQAQSNTGCPVPVEILDLA